MQCWIGIINYLEKHYKQGVLNSYSHKLTICKGLSSREVARGHAKTVKCKLLLFLDIITLPVL